MTDQTHHSDVAVVGGGLAGLTAATLLARAGKNVSLFEKSDQFGGRARTQTVAEFDLNLGPHALYARGLGVDVLKELDIPFSGKFPHPGGSVLLDRGARYVFPAGFISLFTTRFLTLSGKWELARFLATLPQIDPDPIQSVSLQDWICTSVTHPNARRLLHALFRLSTYANAPKHQSAGAAVRQVQLYIGPWLPEPLLTDQKTPDMAELSESLTTAFLTLLETLSPIERAAFLLREVFDYDYADIACIVDKTEDNCRQMVRRAKQRTAQKRPRFTPPPEAQSRLLARFMTACSSGDLDGLIAFLADDITLYSDGGGKATAARNPIHGALNVARFLLGLFKKAPPGVALFLAPVNGRPGLFAYLNGQPFSVFTLDGTDTHIQGIYITVNPDKLTRIPSQSHMAAIGTQVPVHVDGQPEPRPPRGDPSRGLPETATRGEAPKPRLDFLMLTDFVVNVRGPM